MTSVIFVFLPTYNLEIGEMILVAHAGVRIYLEGNKNIYLRNTNVGHTEFLTNRSINYNPYIKTPSHPRPARQRLTPPPPPPTLFWPRGGTPPPPSISIVFLAGVQYRKGVEEGWGVQGRFHGIVIFLYIC